MKSEGARLYCKKCGRAWYMDEYGRLMDEEEQCLIKIPECYEWQRKNVEKEIDEENYLLDMKVQVDALPNGKNFIDCGIGHLVHSKEGYVLTYNNYETKKEEILRFAPTTMLSVHTEYNYRGKGQCIPFSTLDNTLFLFPCEEGFNATKIQFATEYLYKKNS